jgi:predicted RND superfamily exporter protein
MINAKTLRNTYFPKDDTAFVNTMKQLEQQIIAAAKAKKESVIVKVPRNLKDRIKAALEDEDYTVSSSAVGRCEESMDSDEYSHITIFWPEDLVFWEELH